jgi:hypothetical protein
MDHELLIDDDLAGPPKLREVVEGMAEDKINAVPHHMRFIEEKRVPLESG